MDAAARGSDSCWLYGLGALCRQELPGQQGSLDLGQGPGSACVCWGWSLGQAWELVVQGPGKRLQPCLKYVRLLRAPL